jgi:hypothetical protein
MMSKESSSVMRRGSTGMMSKQAATITVGIKPTVKTGNQARKNQIYSEDLAQYFLTLSKFGALTVCP